jgi:RNA polymerase primary sigma factor/RNA polymerase nonessential primary-like sigma factor
VAERFGLTRERIRQIEKEALAKLRQPGQANRLSGFAN